MAELTDSMISKLNKKDIIELLQESRKENRELKEQMNKLAQELQETNQKLQIILEKWNLAQAKRFGASSEKMKYNSEEYQQMELAAMYAEAFNEVDAAQDKDVPEPAIDDALTVTYTRKKKNGKREEDLSSIPHAEPIFSELTEEELIEKLGEGYIRMQDEIYKRLEFHPASFEVKEYHVAVYKSKDGKRFVRADRPTVDLLRNSIATSSLVAGILNYKYVNGLPVYRLAQDFQRNGVSISHQVMCNWVIRCCERYLSLIYDRMKTELLRHPVIQADETTLKVNRDGRSSSAKSYMWVYITGEFDSSGKHVVIYDYQKTRNAEHVHEFLGDYNGVLVSDGYQSYHQFSKVHETIGSGCWMHCRRRYANAIKAAKTAGASEEGIRKTLAYEALRQISEIYQLENSWKSRDAEYRLDHRKRILKPLVDEYFRWVKEQWQNGSVPPKSETGEGFIYSINQEQYLRAFLDNGEIPIDNGACERAIKPFCVGRKAWNVIDTIEGAQASAIAYSIAETAKANSLKPYQYFEYLLAELPKRVEQTMNEEFTLDDLMPWSDQLPDNCKKPIVKK